MTTATNRHNLSTSGPGPVKAQATSEICIFCHTPHNANPVTPLWSQALSSASYTSYASSTMNATVGVPQGSSKLCLSCHDGTVALGNIAGSGQLPMTGLPTGKLTGASSLGTNLGDDHPISFVPVTGSTAFTGSAFFASFESAEPLSHATRPSTETSPATRTQANLLRRFMGVLFRAAAVGQPGECRGKRAGATRIARGRGLAGERTNEASPRSARVAAAPAGCARSSTAS